MYFFYYNPTRTLISCTAMAKRPKTEPPDPTEAAVAMLAGKLVDAVEKELKSRGRRVGSSGPTQAGSGLALESRGPSQAIQADPETRAYRTAKFIARRYGHEGLRRIVGLLEGRVPLQEIANEMKVSRATPFFWKRSLGHNTYTPFTSVFRVLAEGPEQAATEPASAIAKTIK